MFFSVLNLRTLKHLPKLETDEEKKLPRIMYTYYGYETNSSKVFDEFQEKTNENDSFLTISLDCLKHKTFCSVYKLLPNELYVSFSSHENNIKYTTEMTLESLQELGKSVSDNGHLRLNTELEIEEIKKEKPLFLFVTRPNSGDLEEKKPIYESVISDMFSDKVVFGYVDDLTLYEKYSHYPYISIVFIPENGDFIFFKDQFTKESIEKFVGMYSHKQFGTPSKENEVEMIVVGDEDFIGAMKEKYVNVTYNVHISSVSSVDVQKAASLCNGKHKCISFANIYKGKAVAFNEVDSGDVENLFNDFEHNWKKISIIDRLKTKLLVLMSFFRTEFVIYGFLLLAVSIFLAFWLLSSKCSIKFEEEM